MNAPRIYSLKRHNKRKHFCLRLWRTQKCFIFSLAQRKIVNFFQYWWFCLSPGKFLRAPMIVHFRENYSAESQVISARHNRRSLLGDLETVLQLTSQIRLSVTTVPSHYNESLGITSSRHCPAKSRCACAIVECPSGCATFGGLCS